MLPTAIRVKQTSFLWPYSLESGFRRFCLYFLLLLYASPSSLTALYSASPCSSQPQGLWPCHSPHLECSFIRYVYGGVSQVSAQMPRLQSPSYLLTPRQSPAPQPAPPSCPPLNHLVFCFTEFTTTCPEKKPSSSNLDFGYTCFYISLCHNLTECLSVGGGSFLFCF